MRVRMPDVIKVEDKYYILATATRAIGTHAVLKDGDTFAVFDIVGDIFGVGLGEQGLYHDGTRFLSMLELRLNSDRPLLLSSRSSPDNLQFGADLTNRDYFLDGHVALPKDLVHVFRSRFLWNGALHERVRLTNYSRHQVKLTLDYEFDADFADIFEVRGTARARRGVRLPWKLVERGTELAYRGLDHVIRRTRLEWNVAPSAISASSARFDVALPAHDTSAIELTVSCETDAPVASVQSYEDALERLAGREGQASREYPIIETSHSQLNNWLERSISDVRMMITTTPSGPYPYAGVPWFNTAFGRDGIITALQTLWMNPHIAAGVLRFLASTQAQDSVPERDAEPGKILHEMRGGEMAALGEVPFGRYYGSVDSTPLFVLLAGASYERTGDRPLIDSIWSNIESALRWIDQHGDVDGDGFVEYARRTPQGLIQQGWKDSQDSVFHDNGELAEAPIALAEVQAYVYGARLAGASLARVRGDVSRADTLTSQANTLRARFEDAFWSDRLQTYALALDGQKRPCAVPLVQRRAVPVDGSPATGSRTKGCPVAARSGYVFRLGHPDHRRRRSALQPDVVPQRFGVAARQRADRRRVRPVRLRRSHPARPEWLARRERLLRILPAARALLRLSPPARRGPDTLPGRVLAAGVGGRQRLPDPPGGARTANRRPRRTRHDLAASIS